MTNDQMKILPLSEEDIQISEKRKKKFIIECIKRYIGLLVLYGFFFVVVEYVIKAPDMNKTPFLIFFGVIFIVFTAINFFIYKLHYKGTISGNKIVVEGVIERKGYSHALEGTFNYKINPDKKTVTVQFTDKMGADRAFRVIHLRYDKKSFDNMIEMGEYLYFIINGNECKVDVSQFALFDEGEKIKVERFENSGDLIRISSLDDPSKIVQTDTLKFFIGRKGRIGSFG